MKNVYFTPWVGENYTHQDFKIMMLGESHYLWEEDQTPENYHNTGLTYGVLEDIRQGGHNSKRTFNNAKAVVTGDYHSDLKFWDDTIFYNFMQGFVGNSALSDHRDKRYVTQEMIDKSRLALFEILDKYAPNIVIAWGVTNLPNWLPQDDWCAINNDKRENFGFYKNYPNTYFWTIPHPSTRFSYRKYHELYKYILNCILQYEKGINR